MFRRRWVVYPSWRKPGPTDRRYFTLFFAESHRQDMARRLAAGGFKDTYFLTQLPKEIY